MAVVLMDREVDTDPGFAPLLELVAPSVKVGALAVAAVLIDADVVIATVSSPAFVP